MMLRLAWRFLAAACAFYTFVALLLYSGPLLAVLGAWITWRVLRLVY
jgi:hypothetical protein